MNIEFVFMSVRDTWCLPHLISTWMAFSPKAKLLEDQGRRLPFPNYLLGSKTEVNQEGFTEKFRGSPVWCCLRIKGVLVLCTSWFKTQTVPGEGAHEPAFSSLEENVDAERSSYPPFWFPPG